MTKIVSFCVCNAITRVVKIEISGSLSLVKFMA